MITKNSKYGIRRIEGVGPRGGLRIEWQTFEYSRIDDHDGGWCQSWFYKSDAVESIKQMELDDSLNF